MLCELWMKLALYKFGKMTFEEALIKHVRMHRCLYDKDAEDYNVKSALAAAWTSIAAGVVQPLKKCRVRWRSLRNRFICEAHKMQELGGDHLYTTDKWQYYDALRFLKPHINKRRQLFTTEEPSDEDEATMSSAVERIKFEYVPNATADKRKYSTDGDLPDESTVISSNFHSSNKSKSRKLQHKSTKANVQRKSISPPFDFMPVDALNNSDDADGSSYEEELRMSTPTEDANVGDKGKRCCNDNKNIEATLQAISEVLNRKETKTEEQTSNSGFLCMLDGYLKQLPEDIRESMQLKILNSVYNKIRELKSLRRHN